ncbi:MAG: helix-turn-helix domain-containing protein [Planctomycetota bacterium]
MAEPIEWNPRGVLRSRRVEEHCRVQRFAPREPLADSLEHIWAVAWDLRGREPRTAETLPHPSVHVVVEAGRSGVSGATTERFSRALEGRGWVLGLKFHPGCFRPFSRLPIAELTDRVVGLDEALGAKAEELERAVLAAAPDAHAAAERAEAFLAARLAPPDPDAQLARRIVARIGADPHLRQAHDVAVAAGLSLRSLQRLFRDYVGVGPKWVIQRYRLHEAVARLDAGEAVDLAALALELGYFDQAHFTRRFKALVGSTPAEYGR